MRIIESTLIVEPPGGEGLELLTVTFMELLPVFPPLSLTDAVIVWVPGVRVAEELAPEPIAPSRLELHESDDVRTPSSESLAVPENEIEVPSSNVESLDGAVISTVGGSFTGGGGVEPGYAEAILS